MRPTDTGSFAPVVSTCGLVEKSLKEDWVKQQIPNRVGKK